MTEYGYGYRYAQGWTFTKHEKFSLMQTEDCKFLVIATSILMVKSSNGHHATEAPFNEKLKLLTVFHLLGFETVQTMFLVYLIKSQAGVYVSMMCEN